MVQHPIEDGGGDHSIAEHLTPGPEALIAISYLELGLVLACAAVIRQSEETHGHRLHQL